MQEVSRLMAWSRFWGDLFHEKIDFLILTIFVLDIKHYAGTEWSPTPVLDGPTVA
jgi:hypothetical protein